MIVLTVVGATGTSELILVAQLVAGLDALFEDKMIISGGFWESTINTISILIERYKVAVWLRQYGVKTRLRRHRTIGESVFLG